MSVVELRLSNTIVTNYESFNIRVMSDSFMYLL